MRFPNVPVRKDRPMKTWTPSPRPPPAASPGAAAGEAGCKGSPPPRLAPVPRPFGQCLCTRNEGDRPMCRPDKNNDLNWCPGTRFAVYRCSTAIVIGLGLE